jgi:anthranilate synthase component 1
MIMKTLNEVFIAELLPMGFNGDFNHAIMIRSLSKKNKLHHQAGAGRHCSLDLNQN